MTQHVFKHNSGEKIRTSVNIRHNSDSIKILNDWLIKNCEKPYATAEEKQILAAQTKLTEYQVTRWLSNARNRNQIVNLAPKKQLIKS